MANNRRAPDGLIDKAAGLWDIVMTDTMAGHATGYDTATGWMATVKQHASRQSMPASSSQPTTSNLPMRATAAAAAMPTPPRPRRFDAGAPRQNTGKQRMSRLSESLSDGLTSVELALAPRPPRRDSKEDASDPNNWTEAALRTFLASRERVRPNETRDELQRRCCQILGRKYVPVASSSNDDQRADSEAAVRGLSYSIEKEEREQAALMARLQVQRSDSPAGNTGIFVSEAEAEEIALFQKLNPQAAVEPKGKRGRPPKPLGRPEGASSSSSHAPGPADVSDPFLDHMQQQLGRGGAAASSSTHQRPRQRSSDGRERRRSSGEHHEEKGGESSKPASRASSKELKREKRASRERKESAENAIKRVNAWSEGRSFVQLINSLPEAFASAPPAGIADVTSKEAPLPHDASGSQLKKAFHKASKSLHPDKLRELPTHRRVEAEEVFKSVSAAYHAIEAGA